MTNKLLSVIILSYNEELHIKRCLDSARLITDQIFVIDSLSTDKTVQIALENGAKVISHPWPGTQALQFNWALENLKINSEWILRLDCDEYLTDELVTEIANKLPQIQLNVNGIVLKRRHYFLGKWIKKGVYPIKLLRLFRNGYGKSEEKFMDEHIVLNSGDTMMFDYDFVDCNLNHIGWWMHKHIEYSKRETIDYFLNINKFEEKNIRIGRQALFKRHLKSVYMSLPLFIRPLIYFFFRYFIKLGFLEGYEGLIWHFLQGFWYRFIVDVNIYVATKKYSKHEVVSKLIDEYGKKQ